MYSQNNEFASQPIGERGGSCFQASYQPPIVDSCQPLDFLVQNRSAALDQLQPSQSASIPAQDQIFTDVVSSSADIFSIPDPATTDVYANPMKFMSSQFPTSAIDTDSKPQGDITEASATDQPVFPREAEEPANDVDQTITITIESPEPDSPGSKRAPKITWRPAKSDGSKLLHQKDTAAKLHNSLSQLQQTNRQLREKLQSEQEEQARIAREISRLQALNTSLAQEVDRVVLHNSKEKFRLE